MNNQIIRRLFKTLRVLIIKSGLLGYFLFAFCSNPTKPSMLNLTVNSDPSVPYGVFVNGSLLVTPLQYHAKPGDNITLLAVDTLKDSIVENGSDSNVRYIFLKWKDGSLVDLRKITLKTDTSLQVMLQKQYNVSVQTDPANINAFINGSGWYADGDSAVFIAPQVMGYSPIIWTVNGIYSPGTDTLKLQIKSPAAVVAVYRRQFILSVTTGSDTGLRAVFDSTAYTLPQAFSYTVGSIISLGMTTPQEKDLNPLVSGTDTRYTFISWSDSVKANPRTINLTNDLSLAPQMSVSYKIETATNPLQIAIIQGSSGWTQKGNSMAFTAPGVPKYDFCGWNINGLPMGSDSTIILSINEPKKIIANYLKQFSLSVATSPISGFDIIIDSTHYASTKIITRDSMNIAQLQIPIPQDFDQSSLVDGPDTRYTFVSWNDSLKTNIRTVTVKSDTSLTAIMAIDQFKVQISASSDVIAAVDYGGWYKKGTMLAIAAPKLPNIVFDHWEVNGVQSGSSDTLKCTVDGPKMIAVLCKGQFNFNLTTTPVAGLKISINGTSYVSPQTLIYSASSPITFGVDNVQDTDLNTLVSGTDTRYTFVSWNDSVKTNPRTVAASQNVKYSARMKVGYKAEIITTPLGIATINGGGWYDNGTSVNLTAPVIAKYSFSQWKINNAFYSSATAINVVVNQAKEIVAFYQPIYNLSVTTSPDTAIGVQINGKSYSSSASVAVVDSTIETIQAPSQISKNISSAVPGNDVIYSFANWSDGSTSNPRSILINRDSAFTAIMHTQYKVVTSTFPDSVGAITVDTASDSGYYTQGTTVTFSAPTNQFYAFVTWKINGVNAGNAASISVNINEPKNVVAVYRGFQYFSDGESYIQFSNENGANFFYGLTMDSAATLPNTLIIPKGKYSYGGYNFNLTEEGLYKFEFPVAGFQQRIVFDTNIVTLMSCISQITVHGEVDDNLTLDQKSSKALKSILTVTCGSNADWAIYLLTKQGLQIREILGLTLDTWNANNNGHTANEVFMKQYNKWVFFDLDNGVWAFANNTPLCYLEVANDVNNGVSFNIVNLSQPKVDPNLLNAFYARNFQVQLILGNDGNFYFFDYINHVRIEGYSPTLGTPIIYVDQSAFMQLFYPNGFGT